MQRLAKGRTAEVFLWENNRVLKLFYRDQDNTRILQEAKTTRLVREAGLPVPDVKDMVKVHGRQGIIFQHIEGSSMRNRLRSKPWTFWQTASMLAELHANVHHCAGSGLPSQRVQIEGRIAAAEGISDSIKRAARQTLGKLPDGNAVCHGDFHMDNILLSYSKAFIIDWPDATQGNPLGDVAQTLLLLRLNTSASNRFSRRLLGFAHAFFRQNYLKYYSRFRAVSPQEIDAWQLPLTVAQLGVGVATERKQLLGFLKSCLSDKEMLINKETSNKSPTEEV